MTGVFGWPAVTGFAAGSCFTVLVRLIAVRVRWPELHRRDLGERLAPFEPPSVADEAEQWLSER